MTSFAFGIITIVALLGSIISGVFGIGGGILLISVMAQYFSPTLLIPLHAVVLLVSNISRSAMSFKNIKWKITLHFALGCPIGVGLASFFVTKIPEGAFQIILGSAIILLTWMPKIKKAPKIRGKFFILGLCSSFLSMFIGATGPLIMAFYSRENLSKEELVATESTGQIFTHSLKIISYIFLGFQIVEHTPFLSVLCLAAIIGTSVSKMILTKISDKFFTIGLKTLLTLLALRTLYLGVSTYLN